MPADLTSLDQWNAMQTQRHNTAREPTRPNGIACPKCSKELMDTDKNQILTVYPPRCNVHCPACGWKGTRVL